MGNFKRRTRKTLAALLAAVTSAASLPYSGSIQISAADTAVRIFMWMKAFGTRCCPGSKSRIGRKSMYGIAVKQILLLFETLMIPSRQSTESGIQKNCT